MVQWKYNNARQHFVGYVNGTAAYRVWNDIHYGWSYESLRDKVGMDGYTDAREAMNGAERDAWFWNEL